MRDGRSMPASEEFDTRPVRAFRPGPDLDVDEAVWPASVPAMAQLLREGLELPAGLPGLGGEAGAGGGADRGARAARAVVVFPAGRHDEPAIHLPGGEPGPAARVLA